MKLYFFNFERDPFGRLPALSTTAVTITPPDTATEQDTQEVLVEFRQAARKMNMIEIPFLLWFVLDKAIDTWAALSGTKSGQVTWVKKPGETELSKLEVDDETQVD